MKRERPPVNETLRRCLSLRCPACGKSSITRRPFHIKDRCSSCAVLFKREEGFFVGAILINVATTEIVILLTYLASMGIIGSHYELVLGILLTIAVVFPVSFYHHSWSIWLSFDHFVEGLRKG